MPPTTCTRYGRMPSTRSAASRTVANASGQELVKRLAGGETVLEFLRFGAEILVGEGAVIVLEGHDGIDQRRELFDLTLGAGAEELIE